MQTEQMLTEQFVVAEMNTHNFIFKGAGSDRTTARVALLAAWARHRRELLRQYPERAASLPVAEHMEDHFKISYFEFSSGGGYRDFERIV